MTALAGILMLEGRAAADMIDTSGMQPWETCALCHSLDGNSQVARFPRLAGQHAAYVEKQVRDFRAGRRANDGGQMVAIVTEIEEVEISSVATWYAGQRLPDPAPVGTAAQRRRGEHLFSRGDGAIPACAGCHGVDSDSGLLAPKLEAQHPEYLLKQLADFAAGARANDPDGVMRDVARSLSPEDTVAVASYLASRARTAGPLTTGEARR